jgi:GNAT superfamily N-acetyltransferase
LLFYKGEAAGICKMDLKKECRFHPTETSLFIEKIYFQKGFTGLGLGGGVFREIKRWALGMEKDFLWLKTMQKGEALSFYEHIGFNIIAETQIPYPEVLESEKKMWVLGLHLH